MYRLRLALGLILLPLACTIDQPTAIEPPQLAAVIDPSIIGAGDVHAACNSFNKADRTAAIVQQFPSDVVWIGGDNAGQHGTAAEYDCYGQEWGRFKSRTRPTLGNHDRNIDPTAKAYYDYWNGEGVDSGPAGERGKGYYAEDIGTWRVFFLNSEQLWQEQAAFVAEDMEANPHRCTLATWHKSRYTSSEQKNYWYVSYIFKALYQHDADLIVSAHSHVYERTAPINPSGVVDQARGLRQFTVGTGGGVLMTFKDTVLSFSEKRIATWGVIRITLHPGSYDWQFIDITGDVLDEGSDTCH